MADQPRTQKQIAQKYKDNLDYYRHGHFLRRLKLALFLLAVFGSIGAVFGFQRVYLGRWTEAGETGHAAHENGER